jgi:hypothetical protein
MQYQGSALPAPHRHEDLVQQAAFSFAVDEARGASAERCVGLRHVQTISRILCQGSVLQWPRDWLDDGPTTRQASTAGNYRGLADHAIGKLGAVKLKELTARQLQKALAELPASLPARSLRRPLLSTRLTRSLAPRGTAPLAAGS